MPGVLGPTPSPVGAAISPRQPPPVPDYELLRCIGRGSYGDVWLASNVLGDLRAVKFVYRDRFTEPRPFEREFEGIQRFEPISRSHPSQLHILHVGKNEAAGCFYYVMELADDSNGECKAMSVESVGAKPDSILLSSRSAPHSYSPRTLRSDLERHGRLSPVDCAQIGLSLATALQHLHENKLVHRDIKPSNILFVNGVAKLGDIGLVTDAGDTQSIVGTEGYLPPEGPGTPRADLFSLGKVLYEMSTGLDRRRFAELPEDIWQWPDRKKVVEFNEIVLKACATSVSERYASADELRKDLERLQQGKSVKRARSLARIGTFASKAALFAIALMILVAPLLLQVNRHRQATSADGPASTNELANAKCAKALMLLRSDSHVAYGEVYTYLHEAIDLDPHFARPYIGLWELLGRESGTYKLFRTNETMAWIASRLQELGPDLAASSSAQSYFSFNRWDFPKAEELAKKSIRAAPDYEMARNGFAWLLISWGRLSEAERELAAARRIFPNKATNYRFLGHAYYVRRDFTNAIAMYRQATEWNKNEGIAILFMGWAYRALKNYTNAIDCFETARLIFGSSETEVKRGHDSLRQAVASKGTDGYWEEFLSQLNQSDRPHYYERAQANLRLGETSAALDLLNFSFENREPMFKSADGEKWLSNNLVLDETWDGIRSHPRFQDLLEKVGFLKVNPKLRE